MSRVFQTSIIVPCRNEAGVIESLLSSILKSIDAQDEVIVVEGGSSDATWDIVNNFGRMNSQVTTIKQPGRGKFDAVMEGMKYSKKDYIMIWDADGTVSYDDNMKILNFQSSQPYLLTGDRLKGRREKGAMQFSNFLGNWFFAIAWGLVLTRPPLDTLCGTKKFPRSLFDGSPSWLISRDPYGDFSLIAIAINNRIPIISIPVHYHARSHGRTNIRRWRDGFKLLSITIVIHYKLFFKIFK